MKKIIFLLLCCGVLVSMVGCGGNTAPPPTESPPTTVSATTITEVPTETMPPTMAVEPTEKEKEPLPAENNDRETEPTVTATEPTTTEKPKEETKPTEITKPSVTKNTEPKQETSPKTKEPQEEIYVCRQWSEVDAAEIERLVIEKVNAYRTAQGDMAATMLPGLTEVARYRAKELTENFSHRAEQSVCNELKYGEYIDLAAYGLPDDSYYHGCSREAIGKGDWFGTAESIADTITSGFRNSQKHWNYVGSSEYTYIAVGVEHANDKWYVCILVSDKNYGG